MFQVKYHFSCLQCPTIYAQVDEKTGETLTITNPIPLPALNVNSFKKFLRGRGEEGGGRDVGEDGKKLIFFCFQAMVSHGRVELLAHPLSQKYLQMKWNSYGKYFHLINLLFYTIFLTVVTTFTAHLMHSNITTTCEESNQTVVLSVRF